MNNIKRYFCLIFVCSTLIMNHIVAMDGQFSPKHQRSHSASSSSSKSPRVIIEDIGSCSPSSKEKFSSGNLDDIDWDSTPPASSRSYSSTKQTSQKTVHLHDNRVIVQTKPATQYRNPTWSESLSSPEFWRPVITGITAGTVQALLQAGANWITQDTEMITLERQITLLSYTNKKSMLEATQKALDAKKNIVEIAQTKIEELLSKLNDGQELSDREHEILQRNLSLIQKLTSIAGN